MQASGGQLTESRGVIPGGGALLACLLAVFVLPGQWVYAQGALYVEAYNTLASNLNRRVLVCGGNGVTIKNGAAGATVSPADLDAIRKKVRDYMGTMYVVEADQWDLASSNAAVAFPLGLRYSGATLLKPSLLEGIGDGEGRFTKIPACYSSGKTNVYAETFNDAPLLWEHFEELDRAIRKMRYMVAYKSNVSFWGTWGTKNAQSGWASNVDWNKMIADCTASYDANPGRTVQDAPLGYSVLATKVASLERRRSVFVVGGLNTSMAHRVHYFIIGFKADVPEGSSSLFNDNGDPISEGRWREWCEMGPTCESNVVSTFFGSLTRPEWCAIPPAGSMSWKGYTSDMRALVEWDFDDLPFQRPVLKDKEQDGLFDEGCGCKTCLIEADPAWRDEKTDAEVLIPLGFSDAALSCGVRVKAYLTEYEMNGATQQMYSLDSRVSYRINNGGEGWDFVAVKRPSGAEVLFSLNGTMAGKPVGGKCRYTVEDRDGGVRLKFPGRRESIYHDFLAYPSQNGKLARVGVLRGTNDVYTEGLFNRGQWPGLATGYSGPFYGNPVVSLVDNRLSAVLTTNSSGLVRQVEYRYADGGPTNHIVHYTGSKGFRVIDERGVVTSDVRLTSDPTNGTREIWTGITTHTGFKVARKEKRRQWVDAERGLVMVEQVDVIHDGQAGAASNTTIRAIREYEWGDEVVEETTGAGSPEARMVRYEYHDDSSDTNNYGQLKSVLDADGGWERYAYDSRGRAHIVRHGLKNASVNDSLTCHETEYGYAGDESLAALHVPEVDQAAGDDRPRWIVEREIGREVSRTYHSYQGDREVTVHCLAPGALYDDPSNLVSSQTYVMSGTFKGRPAVSLNADGSLTVHAYSYNATRKEFTTLQDSGTGVGDVVTNGTRRVTVADAVGRTISESTVDIATGIELQGRRFVRDGIGREIVTSNTVDGSATVSEYGCCGPERVRDEGGVETTYVYDELKRVYAAERLGVSTFTTYDVFGNVADTRRCAAGMPDGVESSERDAAGRLVRQVDARGGVVTYAYGTNALGEPVVTTVQPGGGTVVETSYMDGRTKSVTGTAVRAVCYDYGVDERGRYTVEYRGPDTNAAHWVKTWQDMLGRERWVEHADGYTQETLYDGAGRAVGVRDGWTTRLTGYNGKGEAFRSAVDMDGDGVIGVGGQDRVTESESGVGIIEGYDGRWVRNYVYATNGSAERTLAAESWQSLDGTKAWSISHGRTNRTQVVRDVASATREETAIYSDQTRVVSHYTNGLLKQVQRLTAQGETLSTVTYEHDGWGRVAATETKGPNDATIRMESQFDGVGNVTNTTTRAGGEVRSNSYFYDEEGRRTRTVLADGGVVRYSYKPTGELAAQAGAQTYPVEYDYDAQGRMAALSTFRDGEGGTPDVTRWLYDERRGWVNAKVYANGVTNGYEYRQDGRLVRRVSARGIETRYGYDAGGLLTNTVYSDGTPGVGVGVDRLGRPVQVADALGSRTFRYDEAGALVEEVLPGGAGTMEYAWDANGRRTNVVASGGAGGSHGVGYGYDEAGRLAVVTAPGLRADYEYAADGGSVAALRVTREGGEEVVRGVRDYDDLGFLRNIEWWAGTNRVAGRDYEVNSLGQRTRCGMGDGTYWEYGYDALGQLTSAGNYRADGSPVPGRQYGYVYDAIGNRSSAVSNGVVMSYGANGLNQYTSYQVAGEGGGATWEGSVYMFGNGEPGGNAQAGRKTYRCGYDRDGNLTNDGVWAYSWDAENRLLTASNASKVLRFNYDYMGRRSVKQVYEKASEFWLLASESSFVYDGWSLVSESKVCGLESNVSWYVWGLDLSGSIGGAGGIGGLLAILTSDSCLLTPVYDGNGNVTALVDTNGAVAATYEYDPFGGLLSAIHNSPVTIHANPFAFSTKYCDEETGFLYYGYRYYSPTLGRWLSRDPLEEQGGVNLYGFVGNGPAGAVDSLGRALYAFDGTGTRYETWTHIGILHRSYQGTAWYKEGVGSRWYSSLVGGITGAGGGVRLEDMYQRLVETYKEGDHDIDIIGFSRGAALAREFANRIYEQGIVETTYRWVTPEKGARYRTIDKRTIIDCYPKIRFVGLFDTVGSFGIPGNNINLGVRMGLPRNVEHAAQAIARDERRSQFPLTPLNAPLSGQAFSQKVFAGDHSDIGGGHEDDQNILALDPLFYIWEKGREAHVPFGVLNKVTEQGQIYLEVNGRRRPWAYHQNTTPHDLTTSILYTDGGQRRNLPGELMP